jgi:hypothetical protein
LGKNKFCLCQVFVFKNFTWASNKIIFFLEYIHNE